MPVTGSESTVALAVSSLFAVFDSLAGSAEPTTASIAIGRTQGGLNTCYEGDRGLRTGNHVGSMYASHRP